MTPLLEAAFRDETKKAIGLIKSGADPNEANRYGVTPLYLACQNGNAEIVAALLQHGADPNLAQNGGETPLMTAARTGLPEAVLLLLEAGAKVDAAERNGQTAIMWASARGNREAVVILLKHGAEKNRKLKSGFTPLLFAARNGHRDVVKELVGAGCKGNEKISEVEKPGRGPSNGTSALTIAVENGHFGVAEELLEAGADPDDQASGAAPLHILTWVRKPDRGDGLSGLPPPRISGEWSTLEFAKVLVNRFGANPDTRLKRGSSGGPGFGMKGATPFLLACHTADLDYAKLLASLGADVTTGNADETTPLMAAAGVGSRTPEEEAGTEDEALAMIEWLLKRGANVNGTNKNGETAMHGAAYRNFPAVATLLVSKGADISEWNRKNKHGWTPLLIARGYRPGNFKPSVVTVDAISKALLEAGVEVPPHPPLPSTVTGKKGYP